MSDDLTLPQVPEAAPEDPEDVSWALSTAEAMWARGDHAEGIKWVRRAAEAASEAENDLRALHLAKAAADLTNLIARMSRASVDIEIVPISVSSPPPVPPARPATRAPPPKPVTSAPPKPQPSSVTKQVSTPSRPPAPLPSRTSQPPPAGAAAPRGKPLGTNTGRPPSMRPSSAPKPADKPVAKKSSRRSRDNLEAEALAAFGPAGGKAIPDVTESLVADAPTAEAGGAVEVPVGQGRVRREIGNNDPTFVGNLNDIVKDEAKRHSTDEWDASPTQDLTGEERALLPRVGSDGERMTVVGQPPSSDLRPTPPGFPRPAKTSGSSAPAPSGTNPPATVVGAMMPHLQSQGQGPGPNAHSLGPSPTSTSRAALERHDPGIITSQAVRVVVWRDASGVHVAPAGTVVSAITVDAVLVALEPNADLTAWLSPKKG